MYWCFRKFRNLLFQSFFFTTPKNCKIKNTHKVEYFSLLYITIYIYTHLRSLFKITLDSNNTIFTPYINTNSNTNSLSLLKIFTFFSGRILCFGFFVVIYVSIYYNYGLYRFDSIPHRLKSSKRNKFLFYFIFQF